MAMQLWLDGSHGPYVLPLAEGVAVTAGSQKVTLAVTVEAQDGSPVVVFIPIPRALLASVMGELVDATQG